MLEKASARATGESVASYDIEDLPHAQEFTSKREAIEEQIQRLLQQKDDLNKERDTNESLSKGAFRRYGGEAVYQEKSAALESQISELKSKLSDLVQLYKDLGGDKIDSLKAELFERTNGKIRATWSAEAMTTFGALQRSQQDFETKYDQYENKGGSDDLGGSSGSPEGPEGTQIDDEHQAEIDEFKKQLEEMKNQSEETIRRLEEEQSRLQGLNDSQAEELATVKKALREALNKSTTPEKKGFWSRARKALGKTAVKATALVATGAALLGLGLAIGNNNNHEEKPETPAIAPANLGEAGTPEPGHNTDGDGDLGESYGEPKNDSSSSEVETTKVYSYDRALDPYFAPDKISEYNMSNGFPTDVAPEESMRLWQEDVLRSPEMIAMIAHELGLPGAENQMELDDLLTNSPADYDKWAKAVEGELAKVTDVHYENIPAWQTYSTYWTILGENGDPQLAQDPEVINDHDVVTLVFSKDGKKYIVNSECGQLVGVQISENVPQITVTPQEPTMIGSVPTTYNYVPPVEVHDIPPAYIPPVPETPPQTPPETIPKPKDPAVDINVNEDLPEQIQMGDQAGTVTVDQSAGTDTAPAQQPAETYIPPVQQVEPQVVQQVAPEAQPVQSERRQEQVAQGVETGGGETTTSEQAPVNNGTVDPNAAGN